MAKQILNTQLERGGKDMTVIDRLVHEIQNDLHVISMEAELQLTGERSKREPQCAFVAAQNIERLLGEVRQYFLLPR